MLASRRARGGGATFWEPWSCGSARAQHGYGERYLEVLPKHCGTDYISLDHEGQ